MQKNNPLNLKIENWIPLGNHPTEGKLIDDARFFDIEQLLNGYYRILGGLREISAASYVVLYVMVTHS